MIIRRKRIALLESKPGAVYRTTKIIFVKMLQHAYTAPEKSPLHAALKLRNKFNDALNDAVAKIDHYLLTVNSCNAYEDYSHKGDLSDKGKLAYWLEIDDLIHRFNTDKIKLLPNLKNPSKYSSLVSKNRIDHNNRGSTDLKYGHRRSYHLLRHTADIRLPL